MNTWPNKPEAVSRGWRSGGVTDLERLDEPCTTASHVAISCRSTILGLNEREDDDVGKKSVQRTRAGQVGRPTRTRWADRVAQFALDIIVSRIAIVIASAIALSLCFFSMRDVPHNRAIRNPQLTLTILWALIALIIVAGLLALFRSSRMTAVASFVASGLGILFSLILACV
jgi:hypothetical protein